MALETLDDIVEDVLNQIGVYGCGCFDGERDCNGTCRSCQADALKQRIRAAVELERALQHMNGRRTT